MTYHLKGIGGLRKPKPDYKKLIKNMTMIHRDLPIPPQKPKPVRKVSKPYDLAERELRLELLILLRKLRKAGKVEFWRIENSLPGYHGIPDFFCASLQTKWVGFVELKKEGGVISSAQKKFAELCVMGGVNHIFAYSVEDVEKKII